MKSPEPIVSEPRLRHRFGASLLILRVALGMFLLVWGLEKFIIASGGRGDCLESERRKPAAV